MEWASGSFCHTALYLSFSSASSLKSLGTGLERGGRERERMEPTARAQSQCPSVYPCTLEWE